MDTFKDRLKFYMIKAGLNPTSLSKKARLNTTAVRDILKHDNNPNPRIDTFIKLCRALDVNPHMLSPDLAKLYSSRQCQLLDEIYQQEEREKALKKEEK